MLRFVKFVDQYRCVIAFCVSHHLHEGFFKVVPFRPLSIRVREVFEVFEFSIQWQSHFVLQVYYVSCGIHVSDAVVMVQHHVIVIDKVEVNNHSACIPTLIAIYYLHYIRESLHYQDLRRFVCTPTCEGKKELSIGNGGLDDAATITNEAVLFQPGH